MYSVINNMRKNKELINKSFESFKNKYINYAEKNKGVVNSQMIVKLKKETMQESILNNEQEKILNDFYDMLLGMVLTIQDFYLIEKNINIMLNNN